MKGLDAIKTFCRAHYDKILVFVALLALLISLLYLALQIGSIQRLQAEEERRIDAMKPAHPVAETLDIAAYQAAFDAIRQPEQLNVASWTNRYLLFPEERVWCVICLRPIGYADMQCPFCGETQPDIGEKGRDSSGDGIPDEWKIRYGLDPNDPTDVHRDPDGTGFTWLERFQLDPETASPPYVHKLYLDEIKATPFPMRFMSRSRMPDGTFRFALNLAGRTYFTRLGETVLEFEVSAFEEIIEQQVRQGSPRPRDVDVSVLTLKRGDKLIPLVLNRAVQHDEYTVHFAFDVDRSRIEVKIGDTFDLRHEKYRLKHVDMRRQNAVVKNLKDEELWSVRKRPNSAARLGKQAPDTGMPQEQDLPPPPPPPPAAPEKDESEKPAGSHPFGDLVFE